MSHTVVVDEDYRDRRLENRLNAVARHCRIGRVNWKRAVSIPSLWPSELLKYTPKIDPLRQVWNTNQFYPKCGCPVGAACNNAACPHAPVVTC